MRHALKEYVFHNWSGKWTDASTNEVLADVLAKYEIIVDDRTQFARLYDYERGVSFWYRAYSGKITLTLWELKQ